jgi:hypothetical protein
MSCIVPAGCNGESRTKLPAVPRVWIYLVKLLHSPKVLSRESPDIGCVDQQPLSKFKDNALSPAWFGNLASQIQERLWRHKRAR